MKRHDVSLTPAERRVLEDLETCRDATGRGWLHPTELGPPRGELARRGTLLRLVERRLVKSRPFKDGRRFSPVDEDFEEQTCRVCGCTLFHVCRHDEYGACWWVEEDLCSHCQPDLPGVRADG